MKRRNGSLFGDDVAEAALPSKTKRPKLGRYERVKNQLLYHDPDPLKRFVDCSVPESPLREFTFVDLFCGAGGITCGFVRAGLKPLASVEVNWLASETHRRNFPGCKHFEGEIAKFEPAAWLGALGSPKVHIVVGGPPCQGFSVAGKRDPNDPRNKLFYEFVRVVAEVKPWYVVMENVPGILTMSAGRVREAILGAFGEAGYKGMSVAVLESADYGVPQIRPRAIFIGNRFGLPNLFPRAVLAPDRYVPIEAAISDLPAYAPVPAINHEWTKHSPEFMERIAKVPPGGSLYASYFDAFKRQYPGLPSMTIKENHGGTHIHPSLNRVISAREMARLQTFPDAFIFSGPMKKAMWQIGNAVPPRLAQCIAEALLPCLNAIHRADENPAELAAPGENQGIGRECLVAPGPEPGA